jgi:hypothetical protein
MGIHERFDLDLWARRLPFDRLYEQARNRVRLLNSANPLASNDPEVETWAARRFAFGTSPIDGPRPLLALEYLRRNPPRQLPPDALAVDVFVWSIGEPQNPACTKIAGTPYRPADEPWPVGPSGRPMDFLAQICFADSPDLARMPIGAGEQEQPIPGDVLLIFCDGEWCCDWTDEPEAVHFEWRPLGLTNWARADRVPPRRWKITPTHAQIHRTVEYHDPPDAQHSLILSSWTDADSILRVEATKIGGIPFFQQGDRSLPGRHLCALASLMAADEAWPLLNVERKPPDRNQVDHELLMFGDLGEMNISIDEHGGLHWNIGCG